MAKELTRDVVIHLLDGSLRDQHVTYENLPKYCKECNMLGHSLLGCKKKPAPKNNPMVE